MKITAAQALLKVLKANGADTVFGYPGAALLPVYQALPREGVRHILVRTEQGAAHMAASLFRAAGQVGVCLATSGPGATNLLTAVANAYMDSVPLLAITAQVPVSEIGTDAFQEVDTTGVTAPVSKQNYLIKNAADLPRIISEAFYIARSGRPGPVVVDIPLDVLHTRIVWQAPEPPRVRGYRPVRPLAAPELAALTSALRAAKRPLFVVGGGVISAGAGQPLARLLQAARLPSVATLMGLSALPSDFPLFLGLAGIHGTAAAREALQQADFVAFFGARLSGRTVPDAAALAGRAVTAHIDIDPAEIGKICSCDLALCADASETAAALAQALQGYQAPPDWAERLHALRQAEGCDTGSRPGYVDPPRLFSALRDRLRQPVILSSEVGQHQIWTARYFPFQKGDVFLTSGGLGAMGYGLPAAIGAKIARPDRTVLAIEGDGSFQMSLTELSTMVENHAPVKLIVFKNNCLGLVRESEGGSGREPYLRLSDCPDFCALAGAYSVPALRLCGNSEIPRALDRFLEDEGPFLLEVLTDPTAHT